MKLAIMQPYVFPYIGYWQLITCADLFVFFDVVQYNKRSWMNRNRVICPSKESKFQYITVPVSKAPLGTNINKMELNFASDWKHDILGKLTIYKQLNAANYDKIYDLVHDLLSFKGSSFLEFCIHLTKGVLAELEIPFKYKIASEIEFDRKAISESGDWALEITKSLGGGTYINPYGGHAIFNENKYIESGIELSFLKPKEITYPQQDGRFVCESLSIIDALMFNSNAWVVDKLHNSYELLYKKDLGQD